MANNSIAPRGFKVVGSAAGEPFSGSIRTYKIASAYASNIFQGDIVKLASTGYLQVAAAGNQFRGVFLGVQYRDSTGAPKFSPYWPASTATFASEDATALVVDNPNVLLEAQFNSATAITTAKIGECFDLTASTSGSTTTGQSGMAVDYSSTAGDATSAQFRFMGPVQRPDNETGYSWGLFLPVEHDLRVQGGV